MLSFTVPHSYKYIAGTTNAERKECTEEEEDVISRHLGSYILRGNLPGKIIIVKCMEKEWVLKNRSWKNIKDYCRNQIQSMKN